MAQNSEHKYTKQQVENLLEACLNRTLGEIDKNHVFDRTKTNPKITGIAGDVIEQSVFGYNANSDASPDLNIDGILTELKTTGIRISKKNPKEYEAKEPMSITGVSPNVIIDEEFYNSRFWHKLAHLLLVYYLYASDKTVLAAEYANFLVKGYQFLEFSEDDKKILEQDWLIVRNFIRSLNKNEALFPEISHLRDKLLFIDTAPKWPNHPRFRLKRTVVSNIVQKHFNGSLEQLPKSYDTYAEIDKKCHEITKQYKNKTVAELMEGFKIEGKIDKGIGERLVVKMFGGTAKKMQGIDLFSKIGLLGKTIVLTEKGRRTEDMKLKHIDFDEWADRNLDFEESELYAYFCEHSFLCPVFCERGDMGPRKSYESKEAYDDRLSREIQKTTFEGFKRFAFDESFIENEVKRTWEDSRNLIHRNELEWEYLYDDQGNKRKNKSGSYMGAPNFPKSSEYDVFFRGGANVSTDATRTEVVNGIKMLPQFFWLKGSYIADKLQSLSYL